MQIAVTGSIAWDNLMHFPGRFTEQLVADKLDNISLSFLVDDLVLRRGGIAANIAFGMAQLGLAPMLVGAVGEDLTDYLTWLGEQGVDCGSVRVSETELTARFICTTDDDMNQLASFFPGAMSEAREIELAPTADRVGGLDLVVVSPNDPAAMTRHTRECRDTGYPFMADPSQQLARLSGEEVRDLVDGAAYLITNDYEKSLLERKTGWTEQDVLDRVKVRITTHGKDGVQISGNDIDTLHVPIAREVRLADPTGVGDAFRAGFLSGLSWDLDFARAAQVGSLLATIVIETVGPQDYQIDRQKFVSRLGEAYGDAAATEVRTHLLPADVRSAG